ncbi:MAG: rhomboid family intramembrane serine protease [Oscillospiraceae bacterium]|nr:rhomboid family intramembrane serine protease [Oscillospiraceae bacterium]
MKFLDKLERKFGHICIPNLMLVIVGGMGLIYIMNMLSPAANLISRFSFFKAAILQGEIWRVLTFMFIPDATSPIWLIFTLYFYYLIGSSLENEWGSFKFNVFYFTGLIATIVVGFIFGYANTTYLNLSLFIAFAAVFPNFQVLLFFILPIKVKYLAIADGVLLAISFLDGGFSTKCLILAAMLNLALFFGPDIYHRWKNERQYKQVRENFRNNYNNYNN